MEIIDIYFDLTGEILIGEGLDVSDIDVKVNWCHLKQIFDSTVSKRANK